jgi:hypothetical protein
MASNERFMANFEEGEIERLSMEQLMERKYKIPLSVRVSRETGEITEVTYTEDGTWDEYLKMTKWVLQAHGLTEYAAMIPLV